MSKHLKEINETYFEHMRFAQRSGLRLVISGIALIIHGLLPDIFITKASDTMKSITEEIAQRKEKAKNQAPSVSVSNE